MPKRKTFEEFKNEIESVDGYLLMSEEYKNNKTKVKFKHIECNTIFEMRPHDFLRGQRCPRCFCNKRKTTREFKNEVEKLTNKEYTIIDSYKNNKTKVKFKHNICNNIFEMTPVCFLTQKQRCPYCSKNHKLTTNEFKEKVYKLVNDEYDVLSEYLNCNTKIKMRHNKCNNTFFVRPSHFTSTGTRCPYCNISKGETKIKEWLNKNNYKYIWHFCFSDLYYKSKNHPLEFDFKIDLENNDKIILIEFDGEQHINPNSSYKPYKEDFKEQQKRDKLKDKYCKNHENIDLYRIPYTDFNNIENILEKIFNKYN